MSRLAAALAFGLTLIPPSQDQENRQNACIQRCLISPTMGDTEVQRQEIISLEKEAARSIQQSNGTFFRRVYVDDYTGTLSHGQTVDRNQWIQAVESPLVKYESFSASDIKVHIYQDTAIATCLWSSRSIIRGQHISSQIRAIHIYLNSPRGWHVVSGQSTNLPPDVQQPL